MSYVAFIQGEIEINPVHVPKASLVLKGHKSIVNNICSHPTLPLVITCGVEKVRRDVTTGLKNLLRLPD
jgi:hypothetical protein